MRVSDKQVSAELAPRLSRRHNADSGGKGRGHQAPADPGSGSRPYIAGLPAAQPSSAHQQIVAPLFRATQDPEIDLPVAEAQL